MPPPQQYPAKHGAPAPRLQWPPPCCFPLRTPRAVLRDLYLRTRLDLCQLRVRSLDSCTGRRPRQAHRRCVAAPLWPLGTSREPESSAAPSPGASAEPLALDGISPAPSSDADERISLQTPTSSPWPSPSPIPSVHERISTHTPTSPSSLSPSPSPSPSAHERIIIPSPTSSPPTTPHPSPSPPRFLLAYPTKLCLNLRTNAMEMHLS